MNQIQQWVPNEKLKQIKTSFKSGEYLIDKEVIEKVFVVYLDEKQMIEEKAQADECRRQSFGSRRNKKRR